MFEVLIRFVEEEIINHWRDDPPDFWGRQVEIAKRLKKIPVEGDEIEHEGKKLQVTRVILSNGSILNSPDAYVEAILV